MASQAESASRKSGRWLAALVLAIGAIVAIALVVRSRPGHEPAAAVAAPQLPPVTTVSAVGRIEPLDGVIRMAAPYVNGHPAVVAELRAREGQQLRAGQVVAILDGRPMLEAALAQAEARVAQALSKVEQAKAGPKTSEVEAQKAEVARLRAAYDHSQAELRRYETLHQRRDVSTADLESKRAETENDRHMQAEAEARLRSLSEIRPEDVRAAESELTVARAEAERSRLELGATVVHAPSAGKVLHIRAHPGEEVGATGLIEIARTESIGVIAEVYETDMARVRPGQKARISSPLLPGGLRGTVAAVGSEIGRAELPAGDAAAFADSRVVHVQIHLDDSSAVAGMIHGKVTVVIEP